MLALLVMAITVQAAPITVTWNYDDITGTGAPLNASFTKDGVTITATMINYKDKNFMMGKTFTTTLGNFTKIEITGMGATTPSPLPNGTGWSGTTWTGNASSVEINGNIYDEGKGKLKIVFTISPQTYNYNVTVKEGTDDATNWSATPNPATAGQTVTIKYTGTKHVKSIKAVKKATAATAYTLAESTVGMIVGTDGKAYAVADKDKLPEGVTAVGMVAYKNGSNGLVIALADEEGIVNLATAKSKCEGKAAIGGYSWKLPSQDEWKQMFSANGGNEESYTGLNNALATAGGDSSKLQEVDYNYYWSSSAAGLQAEYVKLSDGGAYWNSDFAFRTYRVRACLAF